MVHFLLMFGLQKQAAEGTIIKAYNICVKGIWEAEEKDHLSMFWKQK